jgi:hypothetical protein
MGHPTASVLFCIFIVPANMTHFDLCYAASQLARFMTNPGPTHFSAAMRVVIYIRSTVGRALTFRPNEAMGFDTFVDSNWSTRFSVLCIRSSTALFFFHGCLVLLFSKMQRSVTLSSAEAEFFGATLARIEIIFFRDLLVDLRALSTISLSSVTI